MERGPFAGRGFFTCPASSLLVGPLQDLGELVGAGDDRRSMQATRLTRDALDRTRDGDRCHDTTRRAANGRGHGGDSELAFAHALGPPAAADTGQGRGVELRALQPSVHSVGLLPGKQDLCRGTGEHGQARADRDRVAQTHGTLGGRHADPLVALSAEELRALVGVVAQGAQHWASSGQEPVLARG